MKRSPARRFSVGWTRLQAGLRCNLAVSAPSLLPVLRCAPLYANLRLTHRCSARCQTCTHWRHPDGDELSTQEWKRIINGFADAGMLGVSLTGGDILLRDDAVELAGHCTSAGLSVSATLNGYSMTEELSRKLMGARLAFINLSLDGQGKEFARVRGTKNAADRVAAAIGYLRKHGNGITRLGISATLMKDNLHAIRETVRYALDSGLAIRFNLIHSTHYFSQTTFARDQHTLNKLETEQLGELVEWLQELSKAHPDLLPRRAHLDWIPGYFEDYRQPATPCLKPLLKICVDPNGDVRPCCSHGPVGNLGSQNLRAIANSEAFRAVARNGLTKECPGCSCHYPLSLDANLNLRFRHWLVSGMIWSTRPLRLRRSVPLPASEAD